jgi:exodeoxyribonuclease V beta subunit
VPPAQAVQRELARDWWVYSYSLLARDEASAAVVAQERGAEDEPAAPEAAEPSRYAGARFGNALHAVLERTDFSRWRDWQPPRPPPDAPLLEAALRQEGYGSEADLLGGGALLAQLVGATLNAPLPEGLRLCDLPRAARRDELEFHLSLAPVAVPALLALLHAHGVVAARRAFAARRRLEGLLTGRIDLLYEHAGRYFVLDYKSNRLPDYRPEALAAAVRESEYDLQYVLYTLAVHRWLRFRLGAQYDYDRHLGGVRYLYSRGLLPDGSQGVHAVRPPRALIEALDALFAGRAA